MDDLDEVMARDDHVATNPAAEKIGEPSPDPRDEVRRAREMVPVRTSGRGVSPETMAQQHAWAQDMAKAKYMIPVWLQNNIGDCLGIIDISQKAGLSAYMVAQKTYIQNNRICFEAQAYHAFAQASGLMQGDLDVEYEGDGDDTRCVVTGFLRGDPRPKVHRSEKLKDARPPMVKKTVDGKEIEYVKGSPLWVKKPRVQLFYDTSRDWVRLYCPRAVMGIYSGDEIEETQLPKDVSPNVIERISNGTKGTEGFTADHAHAELDQIAPASGGAKIKPKKKAAVIVEAEPVKEPVAAKPAKAEKPAPTAKAAAAKAEPAKPAASAHAPPLDRSKQPKTVVQWQKYAVEWINAETDADEIKNRWAAERSMRNGIGVTADDREGVETIRDARIQDLSK